MLSVEPMMPCTSSGSCSCAASVTTAIVVAAPAMSHFMSGIEPEGLMHRPPESNVRPLPTKTTRGVLASVTFGLYVMWMKRGSSVLPRLTASKSGMPSFSIPFLSQTLHAMPAALERWFASSARTVAVRSFGGAFTRSRAKLTASPISWPSSTACLCSLPGFASMSTVTLLSWRLGMRAPVRYFV
jgi:hypothetical protein